jgi:tetratricopeptide (TPR) repeat protein
MIQEEDYFFKRYFVPFTTRKAIIFIVIIGLVVFVNMLINSFAWDDLSYIVYNPEVHKFDLFELFKPSFFNHGTQYRAFSAVYFSFLHNIFTDNAFFYHFAQLLLHITNTALLFLFLKKFFTKNVSFVLSLLFLIHPIQVESVSFIGATVNPLFFFFGITTLLIVSSKRLLGKTYSYALIFLLLLLCLLTKETGAGFVVATVGFVFLFERKFFLRVLGTSIATTAIYSFIRFFIGGVGLTEKNVRAVTPIIHMSLPERILNIPAVFFYYIKTLFFPKDLAIDQVWVVKTIDFQNFYFPLLVDIVFLGAIGFLGYQLFKRKKHFSLYLFFLLWFAAGISIHLQILPLDMTVADRWFYFPYVGLLGLSGLAVTMLSKKFLKKQIVITIIVTVLILLSARSIVRNANWHDDTTLLLHDIKVHSNYELENNLASFLLYQRRFDESLVHAKRSVELYEYDKNLTNLGFVYEQVKDNKNAELNYRKSISLYSKSTRNDAAISRAYLRLSGIYLFNGNPKQAESVLLEAVERYPNNGVLWSFLAQAQYDQKKQEEALLSAQKAKKYFPSTATSTLYELIKEKKALDVRTL